MKNLLLISTVIAFSFTWASCSAPKGLKFQKVQDLTILKDRNHPFIVYLQLYNPNKFPLEIKYGNIETFLEDQPLGELKYDTVIKVGGKETLNLPLAYNPDYRNMFANPEKRLSDPNLNVKINGSLAVEHKTKFYITNIHFQGDLPQAQ
ncbi:MAG: hypothetical protein P4L41_03570 [Flavipsychrobacter sp.]|nr:hypothetical protein [Flavipsychrobacter sp.]